MKARLAKQIKQFEQQDLLRKLTTFDYGLNFTSNDYLGLSKHPKVVSAIKNAVETVGVGSCAAQTIGGYHAYHAELVAKFIDQLGAEDACLFSSGYMANMALISALCNSKQQNLYLDRQAHASHISGAKISNAKLKRFKNCDLDSLAAVVDNHGLVVTDTIFSMSGRVAPVKEIYDFCQQHNDLTLALDDAHGFGFLSTCGAHKHFGIPLTTTTITFGKALGTSGAIVVGEKIFIEAIRQFASPFLFTTAMPACIAKATTIAFEIMQNEVWRQEKLKANIEYFRSNNKIPSIDSCTPIQFITGINAGQSWAVFKQLRSKGILVQPIRPPTVSLNNTGIRIVINAGHNFSDIDNLLGALNDCWLAL